MDVQTEKLLKQAARYELARRSYADYFELAHDYQFELFPHTQLICDKLQKIVDGERKCYIVEMPPQHGKSTTISETFPSYYLMNNPDKEVMIASYSDSLVQKFGRFNLSKFNEFAGPMYGLNVDPKKHTQNEWQIENHKGAMHATTILGSATGKHADLLIIDDPLKNMAEANSANQRDKIWDEWQASFTSRLSHDASIIVIMTRWNVDDLAGRLLKEMSYPWEEIRLPELSEENDILGRSVGQPLCPFPPMSKGVKWAEQIKKTAGSRVWAALYQQRPVQNGGNIFKESDINYYVPDGATAERLGLQNDGKTAILPRLDKRWSSWDLTFTASDTSDYVAGQTWGKQGSNFYLLDRVHDRMGFNQQLQAIMAMHNRQPEAHAIYIEDKANGSAIMNTIRNAVSGIKPVIPHGDKVTRANVVVPFFEAGNVYLPHPSWQPWVREMLDEWFGFPNMEHDDEVDSMTQALSQESANGGVSAITYGDDDYFDLF
ncbi:phage terminase large subunit [Apilactobacillus xinyiensis]|uniref:phage terminase large subunit n=1 Tax=Apilactobacillus xinyiensis TaxID=2841032 RepID=UPI001C7D9188|nr:phage terminase large subunit [Apilactobacillus xinyiensis]